MNGGFWKSSKVYFVLLISVTYSGCFSDQPVPEFSESDRGFEIRSPSGGFLTVTEGDDLVAPVQLINNENFALTVEALNLPEGAKFDSNTLALSWTPTTTQGDPESLGEPGRRYSLVFQASTTNATPPRRVTSQLEIMVLNKNLVPVLKTLDGNLNYSVEMEREIRIAMQLTDPDWNAALPTLTVTTENAPSTSRMSMGSVSNGKVTAEFYWKPTVFDAEKTHLVSVIGRDHAGATAKLDLKITVRLRNRAPKIVGPKRVEVPAGEVLTAGFEVVDEDGDPVSFSVTGLSQPGAKLTKIDSTRWDYSWAVPRSQSPGTVRVDFEASDGQPLGFGGDAFTQLFQDPFPIQKSQFEMRIIVGPPKNQAPEVMLNKALVTSVALEKRIIPINVYDAEGDAVSLLCLNCTSDVVLNGKTVEWTPTTYGTTRLELQAVETVSGLPSAIAILQLVSVERLNRAFVVSRLGAGEDSSTRDFVNQFIMKAGLSAVMWHRAPDLVAEEELERSQVIIFIDRSYYSISSVHSNVLLGLNRAVQRFKTPVISLGSNAISLISNQTGLKDLFGLGTVGGRYSASNRDILTMSLPGQKDADVRGYAEMCDSYYCYEGKAVKATTIIRWDRKDGSALKDLGFLFDDQGSKRIAFGFDPYRMPTTDREAWAQVLADLIK